MKKSILITGAGGFIGRNLAEFFKEKYNVLAPLREELDLCCEEDVKEYLSKNKVDTVIHAANWGGRDGNSVDARDTLHFGLRMFYNLRQCRDMYERMYYFGSGAEYDCENYIPFMTEDYFGTHIPKDGYGFYKYVLSSECMKNENIYDLRLFGVFGKYEQYRFRFISNNICRAMKGLPMTLSRNVYFDYLYIDDLCRIMEWFIENEPKHHHYNVCRGEHIDLKTLGEMIRNITKIPCDFLIAQEGFKREYSGNNERLLSEIGDFEFTPIEKSIEELYGYYKTVINEIDKDTI